MARKAERDPRVDPRPGDVVLENTFTKEVSRVYKDGKEMWVTHVIKGHDGVRSVSLHEWNKYCKKAKVLRVAD